MFGWTCNRRAAGSPRDLQTTQTRPLPRRIARTGGSVLKCGIGSQVVRGKEPLVHAAGGSGRSPPPHPLRHNRGRPPRQWHNPQCHRLRRRRPLQRKTLRHVDIDCDGDRVLVCPRASSDGNLHYYLLLLLVFLHHHYCRGTPQRRDKFKQSLHGQHVRTECHKQSALTQGQTDKTDGIRVVLTQITWRLYIRG